MKKLVSLLILGVITCSLSAKGFSSKQVDLIVNLKNTVAQTIAAQLEQNPVLYAAVATNIKTYLADNPRIPLGDRDELIGGEFDALGNLIAEFWIGENIQAIFNIVDLYKTSGFWGIWSQWGTLKQQLRNKLYPYITKYVQEQYAKMDMPFEWSAEQLTALESSVANAAVNTTISSIVSDLLFKKVLQPTLTYAEYFAPTSYGYAKQAVEYIGPRLPNTGVGAIILNRFI